MRRWRRSWRTLPRLIWPPATARPGKTTRLVDDRALMRSDSFAGGEDNAETRFSAHHAVVRFPCLLQRICLDHGFDAGERAEVERVFGVHAGAGGPSSDCATAEQHRERVHHDGTIFGCTDQNELAGGRKSVDDPFESLGAGDGGENDIGAADLLQLFRRVLRGGVDVNVRAELLRERTFVLTPRDGHRAIAGLGGILDSKMA